jgi:hypothetical protein
MKSGIHAPYLSSYRSLCPALVPKVPLSLSLFPSSSLFLPLHLLFLLAESITRNHFVGQGLLVLFLVVLPLLLVEGVQS